MSIAILTSLITDGEGRVLSPVP